MTLRAAPKPMKGRALALWLLTLVYAFNFIDRQIIGIVSPFIKEDLGFTDAQLGWLKGFAFAVVYCTFAIPIALLADRFNRVKIVTISLAVWSGFTAFTGMATTFFTMLLARMGVGIGEAGGSPPSHSIISDLYSKEERATALGIYSLGIPFGIMFAYFAAGNLIASFGWRGTLIILGIVGIVLAGLLIILVREPKRGAMDVANQSEDAPKVPYSKMLKTLLTIPSWWLMCFGIAFVSFGGYAISNWGIDYLVRWDPTLMEPERFRNLNMWFGLMNGVAYGLGTYGGAKLADILGKKSVRAYGWLPGIVLFVGVPALLYAFWVDSLIVHLILITVYLVAAGFYLGPSFAIAQTLAPIRMRAMSTALFFFILNMIALGGGPTVVGIISNNLEPIHGDVHSLRLAITWLWLPYLIGVACFMLAAVTLPKDWATAEARNAGAAG
jgi:MFS family permease